MKGVGITHSLFIPFKVEIGEYKVINECDDFPYTFLCFLGQSEKNLLWSTHLLGYLKSVPDDKGKGLNRQSQRWKGNGM